MNRIFASFLERNCEQGLALARESDLLELTPVGGAPPQRYLAEYRCKGLVREPDGGIVEADRFLIGIRLPDDYLRMVSAYNTLTLLEPRNVFHSNIRPPLICLSNLAPGRDLVSILYQCYELLTWQTFATEDPLNRDASQWAWHHADRIPVDPRPLKRRAVDLRVEEAEPEG